MINLIVKENDQGQRIDNFLKKKFKEWSKSLIFKLIRTKKVKVNSKKVSFDYRLILNDQIQIFITLDSKNNKLNNFFFLKAQNKLDIVYEDKNIIIVNKPLGLLVYDEQEKQIDTLMNRILRYLYEKKEYLPKNENFFKPHLAHRIDYNTQGIIIAAKNMQSLQTLNFIFHNHLIKKHYLALLYGKINPPSGTIKCFLKKNEKINIVSVASLKKDSTYKEAITNYKMIDFVSNKYSLVDIDLITGRTHQIRASFNFINFPLVGEQKYISKNIDKDDRFKFQCLCSYKITFKNLKDTYLDYLSNKSFEIKNIWFLKNN